MHLNCCARLFLAYGRRVCATFVKRQPEDERCSLALLKHALLSGLGCLWTLRGVGCWGRWQRGSSHCWDAHVNMNVHWRLHGQMSGSVSCVLSVFMCLSCHIMCIVSWGQVSVRRLFVVSHVLTTTAHGLRETGVKAQLFLHMYQHTQTIRCLSTFVHYLYKHCYYKWLLWINPVLC